MEFRLTRTAARVLGVLGLLVLIIGPETVQAKLSASTGKINGSAPTASGSLLVQTPDNNTLVNDATVNSTWVPNNFTVSADTTDLTLSDLDGDCGVPMNINGTPTGTNLCTATVNAAAATKVWKYNNVALTPTQLAAPFSKDFAGKSLTVSVSAPVTVTSPTGVPTTGITPLSSAVYTVNVRMPPVIRANEASFTVDSGFPKTGFIGATFQLWMNGSSASGNSDYTFSFVSSPTWATLNPATGVVTFISEPLGQANFSIKATHNDTSVETVVTFNLAHWFRFAADNYSINDGASYCQGLSSGYVLPEHAVLTKAKIDSYPGETPRVAGALISEWGSLLTGIYGLPNFNAADSWGGAKVLQSATRGLIYGTTTAETVQMDTGGSWMMPGAPDQAANWDNRHSVACVRGL